MAKRNEFPECRTIIARLNAVFEANAYARTMLETWQSLQDELKLPPVVREQISTALEKFELANQAISGLEEQ